MNGFIVVDKPDGMTSHDVVARIRRLARGRKVGHTGTLDPLATGVLPVAIGEGTKAIPFLDESVKEYRARMVFGVATDTQDATGRPVREADWRSLLSGDLDALFRRYLGPVSQIPPMYSAVKVKGRPLYQLARKGEEVVRAPRSVEIYSLVIDEVALPEVSFTVRCSRGTYVRTLIDDIGRDAGCGAHLTRLRRTLSGPFSLDDAVSLDRLSDQWAVEPLLVSPFHALAQYRDLPLTASGVEKVLRGIAPGGADVAEELASPVVGEKVRLRYGEELIAMAEIAGVPDGASAMRLLRVFCQVIPEIH